MTSSWYGDFHSRTTREALAGKALAGFPRVGVWVNYADGNFQRSQTLTTGVSKTQSEEMSHSVGVDISASFGIKLVNFDISLNYQFTYASSTSFTEYSEKTVTESFDVGSHYAKVLFSKHIWLEAMRADGSSVIRQVEFAASDDVHFSGTPLSPRRSGSVTTEQGQGGQEVIED